MICEASVNARKLSWKLSSGKFRLSSAYFLEDFLYCFEYFRTLDL